MKRYLFIFIALLFFSSAQAQLEKKSVVALKVNVPPKIDGVLDEPFWQKLPVATKFIQENPYNGKPATFETEVRFCFDNQGLYIGATMHDPRPDSIPQQLGLRDSEDLNADYFIFAVSPFNDGINAFVFKVYVSNVQVDFKLSGLENESDYAWDAVWLSKAKKTASG